MLAKTVAGGYSFAKTFHFFHFTFNMYLMNILAVETSCDETSVAIVRNGTEVLANVVASQLDIHALYGGVVPEVAARIHVQAMIPAMKESFSVSGLGWEDIDAVAIASGPGLIGSLVVGTETAKTLSIAKGKKIIEVNHLEGHIYAALLQNSNVKCQNNNSETRESGSIPNSRFQIQDSALCFPLIALLASGGHTMLILMKGHYDFEVIGQTRDDAAGEAFDKVASMLGLPYPGGPSISERAEKGDSEAYKLPVIDLTPKPKRGQDGFFAYPVPSLDFSLSGLKTAVLNIVKSHKKLTEKQIDDICASFQGTIVRTFTQNSLRAIETYKPKSFILAGGVSANKSLRETLKKALEEKNVQFYLPELEYCTDNAAMVGAAAYYKYQKYGFGKAKEIKANPIKKIGKD